MSLYLKALKKDVVCNVETLEIKGKKDGAKCIEDTIEVHVGPLKEHTMRVGASLPTNLKNNLTNFL